MKAFLCAVAFTAFSAIQMARGIDLPKEISDYLQTQHVIDDGYRSLPYCNLTQTGSGDVFRHYIAANWQAVLENISSIAPNSRQQELIISAIEDLPGRTYIKALQRLCDLQKQKAISQQILEFAIDGPRKSLLSNNYRDPQVIELVQRLQSQLPKNSKIQPLLSNILIGKQRSIDIESAENIGDRSPETLTSP